MDALESRAPRGRRAGLVLAAALACVLVLPSACTLPGRGSSSGTASVQLSWARKEVVDKSGPGILIARDRTHCNVSANRFESIEIGEKVWCDWRPGLAEGATGDTARAG